MQPLCSFGSIKKTMAEIEELAKHPEATFGPLRQMEEAIREVDPKKAYDNLVRYITVLIGGPNFAHDSVTEEANRQLFIQTLSKCVKAIKANETREAVSIMNVWSAKWKTEDDKALLPEHLMPVAMLAEGVIKSAFGDSVVFVSSTYEKIIRSSVEKHLNWTHKTMLANEVNIREFFSAQGVHRVLPFRTVTTLQDSH